MAAPVGAVAETAPGRVRAAHGMDGLVRDFGRTEDDQGYVYRHVVAFLLLGPPGWSPCATIFSARTRSRLNIGTRLLEARRDGHRVRKAWLIYRGECRELFLISAIEGLFVVEMIAGCGNGSMH
ncbi:hypothetical protein [Streptosporangium sp. NPDC049376]|uniref:hypothetical protein n=1 Tax=Streptosporangium sp. NPDC049376 TaxID=3366192 RepID=UPI0037B6FE14